MVTATALATLAGQRGIRVVLALEAILVEAKSLPGFIDLTQDLGLVTLGLDGLKQDGAVVVPLMDFIADFSEIRGAWAERVTASAAAAREVARQWIPSPDLVEVTLDGLVP